jgi:nitrous oxide reductase accessory protein NosL
LAGEAAPVAGLKALDDSGGLQLSPEDRCPVCAMPVRAHATHACAIQLHDRRTYYFCATGCMIRSWLHPEVYLAAAREELARCVVQDYFSGEATDALTALWVAGSDVIGPMGPALVPLRRAEDLPAFQARHGGKVTFRLTEMDDARWEALTGRRAAP